VRSAHHLPRRVWTCAVLHTIRGIADPRWRVN